MTTSTQTEPIELLVLGAAGTGFTGNGALRAGLPANITVVGDRQDALALLRRQGRHAGVRRPTLILLDLGEHGEQGWTLLHEIKGDHQLRRIPVIVMGATNSGAERSRAYELNANCYVPRPAEARRFGVLLEMIEDFWLAKVRLPTG